MGIFKQQLNKLNSSVLRRVGKNKHKIEVRKKQKMQLY